MNSSKEELVQIGVGIKEDLTRQWSSMYLPYLDLQDSFFSNPSYDLLSGDREDSRFLEDTRSFQRLYSRLCSLSWNLFSEENPVPDDPPEITSDRKTVRPGLAPVTTGKDRSGDVVLESIPTGVRKKFTEDSISAISGPGKHEKQSFSDSFTEGAGSAISGRVKQQEQAKIDETGSFTSSTQDQNKIYAENPLSGPVLKVDYDVHPAENDDPEKIVQNDLSGSGNKADNKIVAGNNRGASVQNQTSTVNFNRKDSYPFIDADLQPVAGSDNPLSRGLEEPDDKTGFKPIKNFRQLGELLRSAAVPAENFSSPAPPSDPGTKLTGVPTFYPPENETITGVSESSAKTEKVTKTPLPDDRILNLESFRPFSRFTERMTSMQTVLEPEHNGEPVTREEKIPGYETIQNFNATGFTGKETRTGQTDESVFDMVNASNNLTNSTDGFSDSGFLPESPNLGKSSSYQAADADKTFVTGNPDNNGEEANMPQYEEWFDELTLRFNREYKRYYGK